MVKNLPAIPEIPVLLLGKENPLQYSWASPVAQLVKNPIAMQDSWVGKIPWRRKRQKEKNQYSVLENSMDCIVIRSQRVGHD